MIKWRQYFTSTIIGRGQNYYNKGRIDKFEKIGDKYYAEVRGSRPYQVVICETANNRLRMSCSCIYAQEGNRCKHMAAVLLKIEQETNDGAGETINAEKKTKEDEEVRPFAVKNVPGAEDYTCFDLAHMTRNIKMLRSQLEAAQRIIEKQEIKLLSVSVGHIDSYHGKVIPAGRAIAHCKTTSGDATIDFHFTSDTVTQASCRVPGCSNLYYSGYYNKNICKHQLAAMLLLAEYIDKYNPGDTTAVNVLEMMEAYQKQHRGQVLEKTDAKVRDLKLEPRLERTYKGFELSFKTGTQKLFVIKNLDEFVENVEGQQSQKFGSKSEINFGIHEVCPEAENYYNFIKKTVHGERLRVEAGDFYPAEAARIGSKINLYGRRMDDLFEIMLGSDNGIIFHDKSEGQKDCRLLAKEGTPEPELYLNGDYENNVFKGIEVRCELPEIIKGEQYLYYIEDSCLYRMDSARMNVLLPLFNMSHNRNIRFKVGRKSLSDFYYHTLPVLGECVNIIDNVGEEIDRYLPPKVTLKFYLDEEKGELLCNAKAAYGEEEFSLMDHLSGNLPVMSKRDSYAEGEALDAVLRYCPHADKARDLFTCEGDDAISRMLEAGINELMEYGDVLCTDRIKRLNFRRKTKMSVGVSLESGLLELRISTEDLSPEELLAVLESYRRKKKYHRLSNGDFVSTEDENLAMLASLFDSMQISAKDVLKGKLKIPAYRALYLDKILEKNESLYVERDKHFKKLLKEFKTVEDSEFEAPASLQTVMRPYQKHGFRWLKTLETYGFGGILADDMGLGKTLQVIAALLHTKEEKQKKGVSLIVAPASLIYNWQEEFGKFAPQLSTKVISGGQAERKKMLAQYEAYDVIITSYDLLKRDIAEYEDKSFLYQIIDEAQYIKNHTTAAAKAVKCIQSKIKYALTGTPIENRLSELWSIFDYLMPGFLYGYETFRKELESPIAKDKDEAASLRLKRMVAPFIMRRLKQDVLKELPDKLEEIQYTAFEERQRKLYDGQVVHMQELLRKQSGEEFSKNKLLILAELTKLREICCDPGLLYENYNGESAKRILCMDLVKRAIEGEHRILIFSQFTSMLSLLEQDLTQEGIAFYKITGATKKEERIRLVKQFNEGTVPVFLISLKAGGTGLNLVGADTVIHYDPWWNQAAQNQATDRAHRIGQRKVVTVYKLIAKDSIEEKIVRMQEMKKNLADEILNGETGGLAQMSREELLELLK